jgi:hypothetical protein
MAKILSISSPGNLTLNRETDSIERPASEFELNVMEADGATAIKFEVVVEGETELVVTNDLIASEFYEYASVNEAYDDCFDVLTDSLA